MAELEILGTPYSNYVRSIRMLCEEKGVAYRVNPLRPHSPEVTAISPTGQIPCLRHGDIKLFESKAIATYIDKAFPGPKLIPEDAHGAALLEQWVSFGNVKVDRWIMREFVVPQAFFDKAKGPDMTKVSTAIPDIDRCATVLDRAVAATGYLVGDSISYADCNVIPMLATCLQFPLGKDVLARHAHLSAYIVAMTARPSYTNTAPPPRA